MLLHDNEFNSLPVLAQVSLRKLAEEVDGIVPVREHTWLIHTSNLKPGSAIPSIVADVKKWQGGDAAFLYYFMLTTLPADVASIKRAYTAAKAQESNGRAYARMNNTSHCFYVGSSKNISERLKQHLGFGAKQTFALQLAHWASPLNLALEFVGAQYNSHVGNNVLQILEDTLWERLNPMFGRKGHR